MKDLINRFIKNLRYLCLIGVIGLGLITIVSSNGGGDGGNGSTTDTTLPSVPASLTATAASSSQTNLSWTASSDNVGVTGYKVYRDGSYLKSVTSTSTRDADLSSSTQYCYTVSAYDEAGNESNESNQACAETLAETLPAPTNVIASQGLHSSRIDISWDAVEGAVYYFVYRSTADENYQSIGYIEDPYTSTYNTTESPATYPITPEIHYFYMITAADQDFNEGYMSDYAEGWAFASIVPDDFKATYYWHGPPIVPIEGMLSQYNLNIEKGPVGSILFQYFNEQDREETFEITELELEDLYQLMLDKNMFRDTWDTLSKPPIGGWYDYMAIISNDTTYAIPTWPLDEGEVNIVEDAMKALVPEELWD